LRIRVLPDDEIGYEDGKTETAGVKEHDSPAKSLQNDENEDYEGPELLSGSRLSIKFKKERKRAEERKRGIHTAKMNRIRKLNRIYTWGDNIPDPFINFTDIDGIPKELLDNLNEFDIKEPSPIQMQALPIMRQRRELLASAPTGSGKTLAFIIPIAMECVRLKRMPKYQQGGKLIALVLEPTRELAKQTYMQFMKYTQKLPISCALMEDNKLPSGGADVIVSTPNRMVYLIENSEGDLKLFKWLRWLIIDESDRLFETTEGDSKCFRNQLSKVYQACDGKFTHRAFFSATFSYEVEDWCKTNLHNVAMVCIGARNSAVDSVEQQLVFAGSEYGKIIAVRSLFQQGFEPPALIFVQSKDRARQLYSEINSFNPPIPTALISSERSEKERDAALTKFRDGSIWVLVCTELIGRGLDLKGVNLVINFDLPTSVVNYIHRIGRTGRAGRRGRSITYFTEKDLDVVRPIATVISQAGFAVPEYTLRMKKLNRNDRKDLLRRPPKRKNIGAVKKRFLKKSESVSEASNSLNNSRGNGNLKGSIPRQRSDGGSEKVKKRKSGTEPKKTHQKRLKKSV
uniref:ATP-dependent RNA helicase n=1 Tax=Anisakis simplex TaxID=6269 RepID=A0A0M3KBP9_ANISI